MGGKFQDGFLSGMAGSAAGNLGFIDKLTSGASGTGTIGQVAARTAVAGVIGGCVSAIGGGKFANGAYTAAFQHLLNAELIPKAKTLNAAEDMLSVAEGYAGVSEKGGAGDVATIKDFHRSVGIKSPSVKTPWCSSFVNFIMELTGNAGTNSAWSGSWLDWGVKSSEPVLGAVAVFKDYDLKWKYIGQGHVTFVQGVTESGGIIGFGGNQADRVKSSVYQYQSERRSEGNLIGYRKLVGFRVPNIPNQRLMQTPLIGGQRGNGFESTR
jgi:uncharacterized protein (TIGR02594 family)